MQWPPRPGPGVNRMKPYGLVAAASTTSHTLRLSRSHSIASSLTSAMLTLRKMFSSSLTSSAASGEETGTSRSTQIEYSATARSRQAGVRPPTTLGVVRTVKSVRPGSIRSGDIARWKSAPGDQPVALQHRLQHLARGARVGGRLEHDQLAAAQVRADRLGGAGDDRDVRFAVLGERRGHADQDRLGVRDRRVVRGGSDRARPDKPCRALRRARPRCVSGRRPVRRRARRRRRRR